MPNSNSKTVIVGLSGGVDSAVSALLLKEQGFHVIGIFMKNWEEEGNDCPAQQDYEDVAAVCKQLEIPHYSLNFSKEYWEAVFSHCLEEFKAGYTPNPDILCNREIKFKVFLKKALELGADYLATGHYCRHVIEGGKHFLARGKDADKDQSYFLHAISQEALQKVLFPVGELTKKEVRAIAEQKNLINAKKKDSTGICFIGKRNFKEFLAQYIPHKSGFLKRLNGEIIGEHEGMAYYTIGQRKGLKIGGAGDAWFVVGKDAASNTVYVEQGETHPALYRSELRAVDFNWITDPPSLPFSCTAKIRYRSADVPCTLLKIEEEYLYVSFKDPQKAITSRQSIVFYKEEICLGGGRIQ